MNNLLKKILLIVDKMMNCGVISGINLSRDEHNKFLELITSFAYIVCFPKDNSKFNNLEIADKAINETELFKAVYFIGDEEYNKEIKINEKLQRFISNGDNTPIIPLEEKSLPYIFYDYFIKDDPFLYVYYKFEPNYEQYHPLDMGITYDKNYIVTILIPLVIDESLQKTLENDLVYDSTKNCYTIKHSCFVNNSEFLKLLNKMSQPLRNIPMANRINNLRFTLENNFLEYIKVNDKLFFDQFYNSDDYKFYNKEIENLNKFLIIGKDGKIKDNNQIKSEDVLTSLRNNLAHSINKTNFIIKHKNLYSFDGSFFISENNDAIVFPKELYFTFPNLIVLNNNTNQKTFNYLYCPDKEKWIDNMEECENYLNKCKKVIISSSSCLDKTKLNCAINHFLNNYYKEHKDAKELKDYLRFNLCKIFGTLSINITDLDNISLLANKLISNPYFLTKRERASDDIQKDYISFITESFYDFDLVKNDSIQSNGKYREVKINPKYFISILSRIMDDIILAKNEKRFISNYAEYRDEFYITLCIFLGFVNLINNGFDDDLDPKHTRISLKEKEELEKKLKPNIFKGFDFVNDSKKGRNDKIQTAETITDFKELISKVRNNIAHFDVRVKFNKSGNPEDYVLIFNYDEEKSNRYYRITCKDFLKFITNPLFTNYGNNYNETVTLNNYNELIDLIVKKLNK